MADYYAILKRAVSGLAEPTGEARRSVYEKARSALVLQLKSFDPPLTASEITQQRLQLEDAIRKVESEAAKGLLSQALSRVASLDRASAQPAIEQRQAEAKPTESTPPSSRSPSEPATTTRPATRPPEAPSHAEMPPLPNAAASDHAVTGMPEPPRPPAAATRTGSTQPSATGRTGHPERPLPTERTATGVTGPGLPPVPTARTGANEPNAAAPAKTETHRGDGSLRPPAAPTGRTRPSTPDLPLPPEPTTRTADRTTTGTTTATAASMTSGGIKRRSSLEIAKLGAAATPPTPPVPLDDHTQPVQTAAMRRAVDDLDRLGATTTTAARRAREALSATEMSSDGDTTSNRDSRRGRGKPETTRRTSSRRDAEASAEPRKRSSRWPLVIGLTVAAAVVALGGTAIYLKRDVIAAYIGAQRERISAATQHAPVEKVVVKSTDRLLPDDAPTGKTTSPGGVKVVTTQPINPGSEAPQPNGPGGQSEVAPSSPGPAPQAAPATPGVTPPAPGTQPSTPPVPVVNGEVPPIVQKATLLEEATDGTTQPVTTPGKVVWQMVKEPSGQPDKPPVTRLKARVEIPGRNIALQLTMEPNADPSLQASHMLKLEFKLPTDFDGKGIARVPGIIMRATEQSRGGDPLAGATAKIPNGMFWIALYADDASKARNAQLMKDRGWIDIPIVYDTNRRAMLSLEKAGAGDRVFSDAFAAWSSGG